MNTKSLSGMFTLDWNDWGKGLVMAALGAALMVLQQEWTAHTIVWATVFDAAGLAGVSYLVKNFFSNSKGQFLGRVG